MSKYKSKKVEYDNITFDSQLECNYYRYLKEMKVEFEFQPKFLLQEGFKKNGKTHRKIEYIGDFRIGNTVIDVKGMETPVFKLKRKLFEYKYPHLELVLLIKCPKYLEHYSRAGLINKDVYKTVKRKKVKNVK